MHIVLHVWALLAWHSSESVYFQSLSIVAFFDNAFIVMYKKNVYDVSTFINNHIFRNVFKITVGFLIFHFFLTTSRPDNVKITVLDPLFFLILIRVFESLLRLSHIIQQNIEIKTFK